MTGSTLSPPLAGHIEVVCEGEPHEMGLAQGHGLRQKIHDARRALRQLEAFRLEQPWWMPFRVFRRLAERKVERLLSGPFLRDYPDSSRRLDGIAEGSGLPAGAVCLLNALEPLMSSIKDRVGRPAPAPCPAACSAVAVRGRRSATGETIIARNFDYIPVVAPVYAMRESRPRGGFRSLDFTVAPLAGAIDGMNERGLVITYNYAYTTDAALGASAPISMAISETLATCATVAEAADRLQSRPRWGGGILMLADAAGDLASLELSTTQSHLRRPADGDDVLFHTNQFIGRETTAIEVDHEVVFNHRAPVALRGRRVQESAERRDCRLRELLGRAPGPLGPDELAAIMSDHGPNNLPGDFTVCVHGSYWSTTASMQYFPRSRRVRVAFAPTCQARFEEIEL